MNMRCDNQGIGGFLAAKRIGLFHDSYCNDINLRRTCDLLLPKLISGEVDVEKIEVRMTQ